MYRYIVRAMAIGGFAMLMASPSSGQAIRADIGPLHIRIAGEAPPRARYERRPNRPHRNAIWAKGYWDRQRDQWAWIDGRWEQPTDRRARWIDARYRRERGSWRYEPAHWSHDRLVEGDDYRQWRRDNRTDRERRNDERRERLESQRRSN